MVCWWRGIWFAGQGQFDRPTAWSSTTCAGLWVVCRFLRGKTTAGVNILCAAKDRKLAREEGSTVRRIGLRPLVLVFGLPLVVLLCKTTAGLPIFRFAKNRKLVPERGVDGPTYRPATNCTGLWVASRSFAMQNHCRPSYFSLREK